MKLLINSRGAAAVEFAIVLPLLLLVLFGIIEFSVAFFDKAVITNASREGARVGILYRPAPRSAGAEDTAIQTAVSNYIASNLITFGSVPAAAQTTINRIGFNTGDDLTITVSCVYNYLVLPGVMNIFHGSLTNPVTLTAITIMKME